MGTRTKIAGSVALVAVPVLVAALWLLSGHERLTKSGRPVDVVVNDELFGGTTTETRFVPGPFLGYYIGLDAVAATTAAAVACGTVWWWVGRRRRRSVRPADGGPDDT
jgi:hypothetical protein